MKDYAKYKWFYTATGKLVVGGKSAVQNDELLIRMKKSGNDYYVMHTAAPGSPFSVIIAAPEKVTKGDLDECAIFTACFSQAWKQNKRKAEIHVFKTGQVEKEKGMKPGMWRVVGKVDKMGAELKLALTRQKKVLRAVPEKSAKKILLRICPGKIDKKDMAAKFHLEVDQEFEEEELMAALPAGGVRICK